VNIARTADALTAKAGKENVFMLGLLFIQNIASKKDATTLETYIHSPKLNNKAFSSAARSIIEIHISQAQKLMKPPTILPLLLGQPLSLGQQFQLLGYFAREHHTRKQFWIRHTTTKLGEVGGGKPVNITPDRFGLGNFLSMRRQTQRQTLELVKDDLQAFIQFHFRVAQTSAGHMECAPSDGSRERAVTFFDNDDTPYYNPGDNMPTTKEPSSRHYDDRVSEQYIDHTFEPTLTVSNKV
jgi:hypothetical protein